MATERRLIDANAIPWEEHYVPDPNSDKQWDYKKELCVLKPTIDAMPTVDTVEVDEVAQMFCYLLDDCPCNYSPVDEWLPEVCGLQEECPHPKDKLGCWKQFIKRYGERRTDNG